MSGVPEIIEARLTAEVLRSTARAIRGERGTLRYRLLRAADALDGVVAVALRGLARIDRLGHRLAPVERQIHKAVDHQHEAFEGGGGADGGELLVWFADWREDAINLLHHLAKTNEQVATNNGLLVVSRSLDAEDFELLQLALDLLDRETSIEPGKALNSPEQAAVLHTRSRLLVVRGKLRLMREAL